MISVLAIAVFVCFTWTFIGFFNKLSSFILYFTPGEIANILAFMMAFALLESSGSDRAAYPVKRHPTLELVERGLCLQGIFDPARCHADSDPFPEGIKRLFPITADAVDLYGPSPAGDRTPDLDCEIPAEDTKHFAERAGPHPNHAIYLHSHRCYWTYGGHGP